MTRPHPERPLAVAGFFVWLAVALPQTVAWASGRVAFGPRSLVWCAAYAAFGVAFVLASTSVRHVARRPAAVAVQSGAALLVLATGTTGFEGALFCISAAQVPFLIAEKKGLAWLIAQIAAMGVVDVCTPFHGRAAHFSAIAFAAFQLFAFGASRFAARETQARAELGRVHAELLATRELFADGTRAAERLRIARELHDALGHHLTALSLQLELARNIADERARAPIVLAHALARDLLVELRSVVSAMREDTHLDLCGALRTLIAGIPHPRVHLDCPGDLHVDAALAHTIFRCAQEALTNAVRHAGAENVFLRIEPTQDRVVVTIRDDGRGAAGLRAGHGLSGLRERIEGMGGQVEILAQLGTGLTLRALLPARERTA